MISVFAPGPDMVWRTISASSLASRWRVFRIRNTTRNVTMVIQALTHVVRCRSSERVDRSCPNDNGQPNAGKSPTLRRANQERGGCEPPEPAMRHSYLAFERLIHRAYSLKTKTLPKQGPGYIRTRLYRFSLSIQVWGSLSLIFFALLGGIFFLACLRYLGCFGLFGAEPHNRYSRRCNLLGR
jgi:hypothetical protein